MLGNVKEALAAIMSSMEIFERGFKKGDILAGILLRLVSFNVMPIIVGRTTIKNIDAMILPDLITTSPPLKIERVAGIIRGDNMVSIMTNDRPRALFPRNVTIQINAEAAVGVENSNTKPVIVSGLGVPLRPTTIFVIKKT